MTNNINKAGAAIKAASLLTAISASVLLSNTGSEGKISSVLRKDADYVSSILRREYKSAKFDVHIHPMFADVGVNLQSFIPTATNPNLSLSTNSLDFGDVGIGSTQTQSITITNMGPTDITLGGNQAYFQSPFNTNIVSGPLTAGLFDFQMPSSITILAGQSSPLSITYAPVTPTNVTAVFLLDSSQGPAINLYGNASPQPPPTPANQNIASYTVGYSISQSQVSSVQAFGSSYLPASLSKLSSLVPANTSTTLAFLPPSLIFGNVTLGNSIVEVAKLMNTSSQNVTISSLSIVQSSGSTNINNYSFVGINPGTVITPGGAKVLRVTFTPATYGVIAAQLTVYQSDGSTLSESLFGNGVGTYTNGLIWDPSIDSQVAGYYIFRSSQTGGPYTQISTLVTNTVYADQTIQAGQYYYYAAKSVDQYGVVSDFSNEAIEPPKP